MELLRLKITLHSRFLAHQKILRYIQSPEFERVYNLANDKEREQILKSIEDMSKEELRYLCDQILVKNREYELCPTGRLREIARDLEVRDWRFLSRQVLIDEIYNAVNRNKVRYEKRCYYST
jgi:hypothetical protein